ncbi:hypothetical protein [Synoicihabitans lomoniglobus]|uniref:HEAT repeat domain-containing protein n=1 Tax=Synoicihabitans lomoniglobus TaxID=2909285 RepID=A0AAE9ZSY6_9BACT|nr:hypothetical protein [Opitutaceae bacterium LMO-M01]WED63691.1 hypothetical protein PXH66_15250 [Opitutaceae bacterium LMO-M01]
MRYLCFLTCLALFTTACQHAPSSPPIADTAADLTQAAFATLTEVLESETSTKQIHAAEVLIAHGRSDEVYAWLSRAPAQVDHTPIHRVVVWRALARSAPSAAERTMWQNKILTIAGTPDLPDRVHAIESVAKLGVEPPAEWVPILKRWALVAPEREQVFIRWALWQVAPPDNPGQLLAAWMNSADEITRLRAAYITRWLGAPEPAATTLVDLANRTTASDQIAAIVLASAYLQDPAAPNALRWRTQLEAMVVGADPAATYHALQGLMPSYTPQDLAPVIPLLQHADADVRVAAAWTILHITQR